MRKFQTKAKGFLLGGSWRENQKRLPRKLKKAFKNGGKRSYIKTKHIRIVFKNKNFFRSINLIQ